MILWAMYSCCASVPGCHARCPLHLQRGPAICTVVWSMLTHHQDAFSLSFSLSDLVAGCCFLRVARRKTDTVPLTTRTTETTPLSVFLGPCLLQLVVKVCYSPVDGIDLHEGPLPHAQLAKPSGEHLWVFDNIDFFDHEPHNLCQSSRKHSLCDGNPNDKQVLPLDLRGKPHHAQTNIPLHGGTARTYGNAPFAPIPKAPTSSPASDISKVPQGKVCFLVCVVCTSKFALLSLCQVSLSLSPCFCSHTRQNQ